MNFVAVINRYCLCSVRVTVWAQAHSVLVSEALKYVNSLLHVLLYKPHIKKIPGIWISHHTPKLNFYYQWYFSRINTSPTWKIALRLRTTERDILNWNAATDSLSLHILLSVLCTVHKLTVLMCAAGHCTWKASSCKNVQTPYDPCQNYTLLRISGDNHRIASTHIYTHKHKHIM
jgi:hypothetical protein